MKNLICIAIILFLVQKSYQSEAKNINANSDNFFEFDLSDDIVDVKYSTECKDCNCVHKLPVFQETKIDSIFFGKPRLISFVHGPEILSLHKSEGDADLSYSLYSITNLGKVEQKTALKTIPGINQVTNYFYDWKFKNLLAWSNNFVLISNLDTKQVYTLDKEYSSFRSLGIDIIVALDCDSDLEVLKAQATGTLISKSTIPLKDLGLHKEECITNVEVYPEKKYFYAFSSKGKRSILLKIDYNNLDELLILNRYDLGQGSIEHVYEANDALFIIQNNEKNFRLSKYLFSSPDSAYSEVIFQGKIDLPFEYESINVNMKTMIIDVGQYAYIIDMDDQKQVKSLELSFSMVKKTCPDQFYPVYYGTSFGIISIDDSTLGIHGLKKEINRELICYKKSSGKEDFKITLLTKTNTEEKYLIEEALYHATFDGSDLKLEALEKLIISKSLQPQKLPFEKQHHKNEPEKKHPSDETKKENPDKPDNEENKTQKDKKKDDSNLEIDKDKTDVSKIDPEKTYDSLLEDWIIGMVVGFVLIFCFGVLVCIVYKFIRSEVESEKVKIKHMPLEDETRQRSNLQNNDSTIDPEADSEDI